jgi:uncharacterized membrane protein
MDATTTLRWAPPYPIALVLGLAVAAMAGYAVLRWAAGGPVAPARRAGLWALRALTLAVLAVVLLNPVRVAETPGPVERPKVVYLVDTSQSMALGNKEGTSRWDQAVRAVRKADAGRDPRARANVSVFRFGSRLAAVGAPLREVGEPEPAAPPAPAPQAAPGSALAAEPVTPAPPAEPVAAPTDPDTQLAGSLEALAGRFGQAPPQAVVVFSDGRAHDPEKADAVALAYRNMSVPVHVLPVGEGDAGGDVAVVSLVAPAQVRKFSTVAARVFVRSYGYKGRRAELKIVAVDPQGRPRGVLAHTPIALTDGLSDFTLTFNAGDEDRRIEARVDPQPGEVSADNNAFAADLAIDHTKIRVLYLEGSTEFYPARTGSRATGGTPVVGAYATLQEALTEDPDIECTAVVPARGAVGGDASFLVRPDDRGRGLPETPSELFAYDAIILSNVSRDAVSDRHLAWLEDWIGRRGGGLCMAGGPNSFASGQWNETSVAKMLPVELLPAGRDWDDAPTPARPALGAAPHPVWHFTSDDARNRALLKALPTFQGRNRVGRLKPGAEVLATSDGSDPVLAAQPFGRGRVLAMTTGVTRRFAGGFTQSWGEGGDARYSKKFWRNVVYWLTEGSSIGRRRLMAETDKRLYRPGEPVVLKARTFDENAAPTVAYRVAVSVEPRSAADVTSDDSPIRRPTTPDAGQGPLLPWGEEFELSRRPAEQGYEATLPISEAKALPPGVALTQGLRIELTAYENTTQVDSTALDIQVLDDPSEQQNPLPDHDLLRRLAERSGGTVLRGPDDLAALLARLPRTVGPPEVKTSPVWSRWWLLSVLIGLLTVEWVWRRRLGLA